MEGTCKGYLIVGENPAVGSANPKMQRLGLANLDWLVVRDFSLIESATWKKGRLPEGARAEDALAGDDPFIMQSDGKGWLYAPAGLTDGPLPTHYEPQESPFPNLLYGQQRSPVRQVYAGSHNRHHPSGGAPGAEIFPYVATTFRLTEHHTAGGMSR